MSENHANDRTLRPIGKPAILPLEALVPNPANRGRGSARQHEDLKSLATSIKTVGLIYPLVVQADPDQEGIYRIVAGERRYRAMKSLNLESAPCIVLSAREDAATAEVLQVVENHQRRNLDPLLEAADVRHLLDLGLDIQTISRSLGRSRSWVARRASLTELSERWLEAARDPQNRISAWPPSHLEVISRFPAEVQDHLLDEWNSSPQWSLPALSELVGWTGQYLHVLSAAPWDLDDAILCPEAGACVACPKRSSHTPDLFASELDSDNGKTPPGDRCLDFQCWNRKATLFLTRRAETLRQEHTDLILLNNGEDSGVDLEEAFQADVWRRDEVITGRKSDDNVVPALVVNGPGLGRVKWVQAAHESAPSVSTHRADLMGDTATVAEKTPEEKRKPYDRRRKQIVIDAVKTRLEALAAESNLVKAAEHEGGEALVSKGLLTKTLVLLAALLEEYGWRRFIRQGAFTLPEGFVWEDLHGFKNHEIGSGESRDAALSLAWNLLRTAVNVLAGRLAVGPGESNNDAHYAEAEVLASMFQFDLAALRAEAAAAVPYAKLWKDQVVDDWAPVSAAPAQN